MNYTVATIHAFNHGPLKGNPAGVCLLDRFPDDATMQAIAARMGHAETAFVAKESDHGYDLRWFTPTTEVPLCGHATLAAAHYLRETGHEDGSTPVRFATRSGQLDAHYDGTGIQLTLTTTQGRDTPITPLLASCIGVPIRACRRSNASYLVEVDDLDTLRHCRPNLASIAKLDSEDLIVTAPGADGFDYSYRCFCPQVGIDEDQVTGSANCILAPFWAEKLNRTRMRAMQASGNGGALDVALNGRTVTVGGQALTIGTQVIDPECTQTIAKAS